MNLLLTEALPLRTTRVLGSFAVDQSLPHRLGDLRNAPFELLKITPTQWFAADHVMDITAVQVDKQAIEGWDFGYKTDDKGVTYTVVNTSEAVPDGATVTACGTGKRNGDTGLLIENPADITEYILNLAGRGEKWSQLRAESAAAGIRLGHSLTAVRSIKDYLDEVVSCAGAMWCPLAQRLYPTTTVSGYVVSLEPRSATGLVVTADLNDTADILRLAYDENWEKPQNYIELTASPQRFGGVVMELTLGWVRSSQNAEAIGRRVLSRLAGERYTVSFLSDNMDLLPGTWVHLLDNAEWPYDENPTVMVTSIERTQGQKACQVIGEVLRSAPTIALTAHSVALPEGTSGGLDVSFVNGVLTVTIFDKDGKPLQGARVSLDGGVAQTTNAKGQVAYPTSKGDHTIAVQAEGFVDQEVSISI